LLKNNIVVYSTCHLQDKGKGGNIGKGKENLGDGGHGHGHGHGPTAPPRDPIPRNEVVLPLESLTLVDCRYRDGKYYPARIVDCRPTNGKTVADAGPEDWDYYVHYRKLNRRMDEWVELDNLNLDTVVPPEFDANGKKRITEEQFSEDEGDHEGISVQRLMEHEEYTKVKNVDRIELGRFEMETWYFSPLPEEYWNLKKLYFCEYDLAFFKRREEMVRHLKKVRLLHPPGVEIYRHNGISMFEVDGRKAKTYCQNLCYLAKLFLDHKTLMSDVDPFLFYVMCECDERGAHIVGYFSKEKETDAHCNLACILTLPSYQRKGYGKFLISFSYELSKLEDKPGTPEKPLSDLGLRSYRNYWTRVLLNILKDHEGPISVKDLTKLTKITNDDIIKTLQYLNMIQYQKGQHVICAAPHIIESHLKNCGSEGYPVNPAKIVWSPHVIEKA
jgi:histone acetyltransferase MYST1